MCYDQMTDKTKMSDERFIQLITLSIILYIVAGIITFGHAAATGKRENEEYFRRTGRHSLWEISALGSGVFWPMYVACQVWDAVLGPESVETLVEADR